MIDARVNQEYIDKILKIANDFYDLTVEENRRKDKSDFNSFPHLFLLGCIMDSQIDADRAWGIPYLISQALGGKSFALFLSKDLSWYKQFFAERKLHRFNNDMAEAMYSAIQKIHVDYNDDASNVWNDTPSSAQLVCRFLEFKKVGIKIATMATNILTRDYGISIRDKYAIDISPDIHVKRAMYRLGLIPPMDSVVFSGIDPTIIIYAAKSLNPVFPGVLDLIFWQIGKDGICKNEKCCSSSEKQCPFAEFCIRQQ